MEPVTIRIPRQVMKRAAAAFGAVFALYAAGMVLSRSWLEITALWWPSLALAAYGGIVLISMSISRRHMAMVLDDEGIRVEGVRWAGKPVAWEELREVLTSDNHTVYALVAADHRLRIPEWAGQELFSELKRRVPLRLERKTWSTRRYVCEPQT